MQQTVKKRNFTRLSDVEELPVSWLWRGHLQLGATNVVEGTTGTHKSTVVSDWAARVTSNQLMPDGTWCEACGGVVWIAYEESAAQRMAARFRQQGGDKTKFIDLSHVGQVPFDVADDRHLDALVEAIIEVDATMVVIDPLMGMTTKKRMAYNQQSYEVLGKLNTLAETLGVAFIIINHTARNMKAGLQSGAGSQGITNNARCKIVLNRSETDPGSVVISQPKVSNAAEPPDLVFKCEEGWRVIYIDGLTEEQAEENQRYIVETNEEKLLKILNADPDVSYSPETLTKKLYPTKYDTVKCLLRRMAERGEIAKLDRGQYQAIPPKKTRKKKVV